MILFFDEFETIDRTNNGVFVLGVVLHVPEADSASDRKLYRRAKVAEKDFRVQEPVLEEASKLRQHGFSNCHLQTGAHQNGGEVHS